MYRTPAILAATLLALTPVFAEEPPTKTAPKSVQGDESSRSRGDIDRGTEKTRTYLGVATAPVHPSLRDHLDLSEGFGIAIEDTMPDSPAAKAGLRKNDVLTQLDAQLLTTPEHLSLLVRSMTAGDEIALTVIRKGQEKTIRATLGEKEEAAFQHRVAPGKMPYQNHRGWQDAIRERQDYLQHQMRDRIRSQKEESSEKVEKKGSEAKAAAEKRTATAKPPAVSVNPGFPIQIFGAEGIVKIDNDEGILTITQENGAYRIRIEDTEGGLVHEGGYDPAAGPESLPHDARKHLEKMKLENLEVLTPAAPEATPEKMSAPPKDDAGVDKEIL